MSPDGCVALPRGAVGLLWFVIVVFPNHTHLLFLILVHTIFQMYPWQVNKEPKTQITYL